MVYPECVQTVKMKPSTPSFVRTATLWKHYFLREWKKIPMCLHASYVATKQAYPVLPKAVCTLPVAATIAMNVWWFTLTNRSIIQSTGDLKNARMEIFIYSRHVQQKNAPLVFFMNEKEKNGQSADQPRKQKKRGFKRMVARKQMPVKRTPSSKWHLNPNSEDLAAIFEQTRPMNAWNKNHRSAALRDG